MTVQNLSNINLAFLAQSGLGTLAAGAGGTSIEVLPSQGLAMAIQSIESNMIRRSRMRKRPRHGSRSVTASYETELVVGALDKVFEAVLGGTAQAAQNFANTDWGAVVLSGTGTIATFATGTLLTDSVIAGMMIKFANLSVTANNAVWVPILSIESETIAHLAPGYLIDNTSDAAWTAVVAKNFKTTTPYVDRLFTVEEQQDDLNMSKLGEDMRFNSLNFDCQANNMVKIGFGLGGRNMSKVDTGDYPKLTGTSPVEGESLILLDGGLFINGVKRANVTGFQWGLAAPVTGIPVIGSNISPDIFIGQFALTGNFNVVLEDFDDFDSFLAEDDVSVILHCAEKDGDPQKFVTFYLGHMSYAGFTTPIGGEGGSVAAIPLYGGEDVRGAAAGYAATSVLISTSD